MTIIDEAIQKLPINNSALSDIDKQFVLRKVLLRDSSQRFSAYDTEKQTYKGYKKELIKLITARLLKEQLSGQPSAAACSL